MLVICKCGFCRSTQPFKSSFKKMVVSCERCVGRRNVTQAPPQRTVVVTTTRRFTGLLRIERAK